MALFCWIDRYLGGMLDLDLGALKPGERRVVESERRLHCEQSYGFVHIGRGKALPLQRPQRCVDRHRAQRGVSALWKGRSDGYGPPR